MAPTRRLLAAVLLAVALPLLFVYPAEAGTVGVNYGRVANNLPSPAAVVQLLKQQGVAQVKLYDADPTVLRALANTGIKVVVALPNEQLAAAASRASFALLWVRRNVAAYHPATQIRGVAVGNEVFASAGNVTAQLVPAMANVHAALARLGLDGAVKVSSPIKLTALASSYPPSAGAFQEGLAQAVMKPMLDFLAQTGSYLMVNAYPFFAYSGNAGDISLDYALFCPNAGVLDPGSGPQVLQPPGRPARRRVRRRRQAREQLQWRARRGLRDRVAVQGRRQRGGRVGGQRRGVQRQPRAPRALRQRRHASPPRRRHRRLPLRALQREPEARPHLRTQLRRLLPEPAEGVRRRLRPRRQPGQRRPRVAGERRGQQRQRQHQRAPAERGEGHDRRGVVRGERHGRGAAPQGGAGLRVRPRRRGLQGHPARRGVLRAQHHGRARLLRLQRLLPAQGPVHRDLRLRRLRLRRQPGTKDGQVRPPVDGLNGSHSLL